MFIKVEPAEFFMYRVIMIFDLDNPNSEDQEARDYMTEQELEPKYQRVGDFEGSNSEFMQFGGCYLGKHLNSIGQIQRRIVELELLTGEVEIQMESLIADGVPASDSQRQATIEALVKKFNQESAFEANDQGELTAILDGESVREAARKLLAGPREEQI